MYLIGQLAKAVGINIETVRYYQRIRLIAQPEKPAAGFRRYSVTVLNQLHFIKRGKELGLTLEEIAHLLHLDDSPCHQVQDIAEYKLSAVKEKIADLRRLEAALERLLTQCHNNKDDNHCPIIDSLQP